MILRTLALEGWRCFANRIEIGPLSDGINVLHGPNSSGKSTLMWALIRGLFDYHAGTAKALKALRPWGRDLNPTVDIGFEHDGETYSLAKRFLQGSYATLSRKEDGQMVRLAEGVDANQRLREMLAGEAPGRGETNSQHWGIAQVLWAPQKGLALNQLSAGMTAAIQQALGTTLLGGGQIENRIAERYQRIYTAGGRIITGANAPPAVAMEEDLEESRKRKDVLAAKLKEYEDASRRAEDFRNRRDQSLRDCEQRQRDLETARQRAQLYREAQTACDRHQAEANAGEAQYSDLQRRVEGIKTTRQELADAEQELIRVTEDLTPLRRQSEQCRTESENTSTQLDRIRTRRSEVDAAEDRANLAARFLEQHRRLSETDDLLRRIEVAQQREVAVRDLRLAVSAPSAEMLRTIGNTVARRDQAQIKFDAALITVRLIPEKSLELEVLCAEQVGNRPAASGQLCEIKGAPEVAFRIPGIGSFRATGPCGSVEELRQRIADANREILDLADDFGTCDLDALQALHARAAALDTELGSAQATLAALLAGRKADDIRTERAALSVGTEGILRQYPAWAEVLPDADALRVEAMRIRTTFVREVEQAEALQKQSQQAMTLASQNLASHEASARQLQQRVAAIRPRLETLANDGKDEAQREAELLRLAMGWQVAKARLDEAKGQLRELGTDPTRELRIIEEQVRHLQKSGSDFDAKFHGEQGSLQTLANEAPYSALVDVEERIEELEAGIARERLSYEAIRLLHERIQYHRKSLNREMLGPVTQRASGMLQRISGPRLGSVQFGTDFLPTAVTPEAAGNEIEIDELCGGEQEQIYLAVRLALADVLFSKQRQLVVLDDALTYTDSSRFARILGILEEEAARFQILVLTCHPERYTGLSDACFIDIEGKAT